jgi:anti-sigma regulatory factor (Ser/Thr protein kinase)
MDTRKIILNLAKNKKKFKTADVLADIQNRFSRQYVTRIITELVLESKLAKSGSTNKSVYSLPSNIAVLGNFAKKRLLNKHLQEHIVLEQIKSQAPFALHLRDNVRSIFDYSFSEILNNAIEHSESKNIEVEVGKKNRFLQFTIRDYGIGVFRNVMKNRKLDSEFEAMQDLLKGKTTTAPKAHSGEGIFFTSKAADRFVLESFGYKMTVDNLEKDIFFDRQKRSTSGTRVTFDIMLTSKKHLADIFNKYQINPDDFAFNKTEIQVKLYTIGTVHISRSQARRIVSGLSKFEMIILDFDKVPTVGQAFADEIFRVFRNKYPKIKVIPINMNESVEFMIKRAEK